MLASNWLYWRLFFCKLKMYVICLTFSVFFLVVGEELIQPGPPESCFKTSFHVNDQCHKDVPSPEGSHFPECQSWKESLYCTLALAETLSNKGKAQGLYNFSHELCGNISPGCAEYLRVSIIAVQLWHCIHYCVACKESQTAVMQSKHYTLITPKSNKNNKLYWYYTTDIILLSTAS